MVMDESKLAEVLLRFDAVEIKLHDIAERVLKSEKRLSEPSGCDSNGRKDIPGTEKPKEFDNFQGASFRKIPGGRYENTAYCESCKVMLSAHKDTDLLICPECGKHPGFNKLEMPHFIKAMENMIKKDGL